MTLFSRTHASLCLIIALCVAAVSIAAPSVPAHAASTAQKEVVNQPVDASVAKAPEAFAPAAVTMLNRKIVVLRGTLFGHSPQERAAAVTGRVMRQIDQGMYGPVTQHKDPSGVLVQNSGDVVLTITPADLDLLSQQTMDEAADEAVRMLTLVLQEAREMKSMPNLLKSAGYALAATVLFAAMIWIIRRLYRWLLGRLKNVVEPSLQRLTKGGSVYLTDIVTAALRFLLGLAAWVAGLFAADLWLTYCLHQFPYTRPWGETLREQVVIALMAFGRTVLGSLPDLLVIVFIFLVTRLLVQLVKRVFAAIEKGQLKVKESFSETARPTYRIVVAALWIFAVVAAYPYIPGSGTDAFKGVSIFVGLLVSLGSTSVVGQAASGLILMYSRTLRQGEYVRVGDTEGTVLSVGLLSTKVRTVKNEEVSIPNGVMIGTVTKNFSRLAREHGVILHTAVTIGYDTPWRQVHAMLLQAAGRTEGLLREPHPFVLQTALSDFYVAYQLNAHLRRPEDRIPVLAALHANIQDAFNEHGVQIMSPHYLGDPAQTKTVPRDQWYRPPARQDDARQEE